MPTPLAKAAKRGAILRWVPITVAGPAPRLRSEKCRRTSSPQCVAPPDSARPSPSRIDFLPSATTSAGRSPGRALQINSATYRVRFAVCCVESFDDMRGLLEGRVSNFKWVGRDGRLVRERAAMFRREMQPDGPALLDGDVDRRDRAHRFTAGQRDEIVPV